MRTPSYSSQFHRDVKRIKKRGKDLEKLKRLIELGNTFECQPESTETRAKSETVVRMNVQFIRRVFEAIVVFRKYLSRL